jgi:hypothetical protein
MSELIGSRVKTPELIAAFVSRDEDAVLVPAVNPSDSIVELEEASFNSLATIILDVGGPLSALVVVFQKVAS